MHQKLKDNPKAMDDLKQIDTLIGKGEGITKSFKKEYLELLEKYEIDYKDEFLFDFVDLKMD